MKTDGPRRVSPETDVARVTYVPLRHTLECVPVPALYAGSKILEPFGAYSA